MADYKNNEIQETQEALDSLVEETTLMPAAADPAQDGEDRKKRRILPFALWGAMGVGIALACALELGAPVQGVADQVRAAAEPVSQATQKTEPAADEKDDAAAEKAADGSEAGANAATIEAEAAEADKAESAEEEAGTGTPASSDGASASDSPSGTTSSSSTGTKTTSSSGSKPASSSSNSSSKPASSASSSSSKPSGSSGSSGSSSSSSSAAAPKPKVWVVDVPGHYEKKKTGTRQVVTGQKWVVDQPAWDEEIWATRSYWKVSDGSVFATEAEAGAYMENKIINEGVAPSSLSYGKRYEDYVSGYIHHDEQGHWEDTYGTEDVYEDVWVPEKGHWE